MKENVVPPPDEGEVKVSLDALKADASMWAAAAADLRSAATVGDRLDLSRLQLTYMGEKVGLVETYQQIQAHLVSLLNQGASNFDHIAATLRNAADEYAREDAAGAHAIKGALY
jgi:uncharacterized protein YukE